MVLASCLTTTSRHFVDVGAPLNPSEWKITRILLDLGRAMAPREMWLLMSKASAHQDLVKMLMGSVGSRGEPSKAKNI